LLSSNLRLATPSVAQKYIHVQNVAKAAHRLVSNHTLSKILKETDQEFGLTESSIDRETVNTVFRNGITLDIPNKEFYHWPILSH
jgi:hypothetical protein